MSGTYYELTHSQKRIWFIDRLHSTSPLHNIGGCLNIRGAIDVARMKQAINLVIQNNDGLRLRFTEAGDQPMQYILEYTEQDIDFLDFSSEEKFKEWSENVFKCCFDLFNGPLFYFAIYNIHEEMSGVLLSIHHIISDGWSIALIERQICQAYDRMTRSQETFITASSYIDYIFDEAKYLDSPKFVKNKEFWVKKFQNRTDRFLYNATQSTAGKRHTVDIDSYLSEKIKRYIIQNNCSLNTFFIAALLIYLYKTTGEKDITIGIAVFNRTNKNQRNMVGMFTSTMPFRFDMDTEITVKMLIDQLNSNLKYCYFNQKYPYDLLVKDLELSKSGYDSLFKMAVNCYNMEMGMDNTDLEARVDEYYNGSQSYSLQMTVKEWAANRLTINIDYKTQEYTEEAIRAMQSSVINIVKQLMNKEILVRNVKLLSKEEIKYKQYCFNATQNSYRQKTVCQLFEEQAKMFPGKIALEVGNILISYQELNEKANQLASYLTEKNIGIDTVVAVMATHTSELVISILGILKSGAAYVPIDPNYPVERIGFMLSDSQSKVLLVNYEVENIKFGGEIINVKHLDLSSYLKNNQTVGNGLNNLAYIIYTSGSTGKPKGTMIRHLSLTNYIQWAGKKYFKNEDEAIALYSSIAFDLTVTSIFAPLVFGHKMVIYVSDETEFILHRILRENKVTVIKLTPAHLILLRGMDNHKSQVKTFIVGGDDLKVSLAKEIIASFTNLEIYNEYGPTEATVGCMIHKYDAEHDTGLSVPIGCPIDNAQVYILDNDLDVVPDGLTGELYISGDGIALGYLNNDQLTLEKFITNPFHGRKMYRSGDLARYCSGGLIEYAGRADNQVKVRGYRVELGEIENCLAGMEAVKNATVVFKKGLIIAYVVAYEISDKEIKRSLANALPAHMIPDSIIFMEALPLTINGKLDMSLLPDPQADGDESRHKGDVLPVEKILIEAFEEVLGITNIGIYDNFYSIGGDSIKAIQISARLNHVNYAVKAKDILKYKNIKEIAEHAAENIDVIDQGQATGSFTMTPVMKWFFEQGFADENHYNQSILLEIDEIDFELIQKAVIKLIERHDALRLNYDRRNQTLFYNNEISSGGVVEYHDLSEFPEYKQNQMVTELGTRVKSGFDIEKGGLLRACLFGLGRHRGNLLLLAAHHLAVDGISWRIILDDLDCLLNGQEAMIPSKTHSYLTWSNQLNEYSKNSFESEKQYWSFFSGQDFYFPIDFDKGTDTMENSMLLHIVLDKELTNNLIFAVKEMYGLELQETLTIVLATVISDITEKNNVVIELEGHGREEIAESINVSRTVGWFTSLFPVRLEVPSQSLDKNIMHLKMQLRQIPNKGFDFGILRYLNAVPGCNSSFIRLNYLGDIDSSLHGKAFHLSDLDSGHDIGRRNHLTALFDINSMIKDKKLQISLLFSKNKFRAESIQNFLNIYVDRLGEIVNLSISESGRKLTPLDFSVSDISQEDLDFLLS